MRRGVVFAAAGDGVRIAEHKGSYMRRAVKVGLLLFVLSVLTASIARAEPIVVTSTTVFRTLERHRERVERAQAHAHAAAE